MNYVSLLSNNFHESGLLLTRKLLNRGFLVVKLKSLLGNFVGRDHDFSVNTSVFLI